VLQSYKPVAKALTTGSEVCTVLLIIVSVLTDAVKANEDIR